MTRARLARRRRRSLVYTIDLDQATVDQLALGRCPEALARQAWELQGWRRAAIRATTPDRKVGRRR